MTTRKGFTLIELMVVIAVIGILAAVALISLTGVQKSARDSSRKSNISDYATALGRYYTDNNVYPVEAVANTADTDTGAGTGIFGNASSLVTTYMPKVLNDPLHGQGGTPCNNGAVACQYQYFGSTTNYNIWATLEVPAPGNNPFFVISSNGTRQYVNAAPASPTTY